MNEACYGYKTSKLNSMKLQRSIFLLNTRQNILKLELSKKKKVTRLWTLGAGTNHILLLSVCFWLAQYQGQSRHSGKSGRMNKFIHACLLKPEDSSFSFYPLVLFTKLCVSYFFDLTMVIVDGSLFILA